MKVAEATPVQRIPPAAVPLTAAVAAPRVLKTTTPEAPLTLDQLRERLQGRTPMRGAALILASAVPDPITRAEVSRTVREGHWPEFAIEVRKVDGQRGQGSLHLVRVSVKGLQPLMPSPAEAPPPAKAPRVPKGHWDKKIKSIGQALAPDPKRPHPGEPSIAPAPAVEVEAKPKPSEPMSLVLASALTPELRVELERRLKAIDREMAVHRAGIDRCERIGGAIRTVLELDREDA